MRMADMNDMAPREWIGHYLAGVAVVAARYDHDPRFFLDILESLGGLLLEMQKKENA
jgi:hypothetical protein